MFGEPFGKDIGRMWELNSGRYSSEAYSDIITRAVAFLYRKGHISKDLSLVDIGSGPGTFAIPMSRHCSSVLCVDSSPGMLERVSGYGIGNISVQLSDCLSMPPGCARDVAFCSLCPPMNCPEGLAAMEAVGRRRCIYLSSNNPCPGIESEIWSALGEDHSYSGYDTKYPERYLRSIGRECERHTFTQTSRSSVPAEELEAMMLRKIGAYRPLGDREREAVREVVSGHSEDGMVYRKNVFRMGMLIWAPVHRYP